MATITPESLKSDRIFVKSESPEGQVSLMPRTTFNGNQAGKKSRSAAGPSAEGVPAPAKAKKQKSRNGCITCKKKRLKCDETHPTCINCNSRGIVCGGYTVSFKWKTFEDASSGFKTDKAIKKDNSATTSEKMARSMSASATNHPNDLMENLQTVPPGFKKMSRALSSVGSDVLQKALEDATLSVTGKTYQELAIANALAAAGKNPDLAAAVARNLGDSGTDLLAGNINVNSQETNREEIHSGEPKKSPSMIRSSSFDAQKQNHSTSNSESLNAPVNTMLQGTAPTQSSPSFSSYGHSISDFFLQKNNAGSALSPGFNYSNSGMSPHLQDILHAFDNNEVSTPGLLENFNHNLSKTRFENNPSPAPSLGVSSPRFSTLMKSFTNFDPALVAPSPADLDNSELEPGAMNKKRRFSELSSFSPAKEEENKKRITYIDTVSAANTNEEYDSGTTYEPLSPTNSTASNGMDQLAITNTNKIPFQIELSDERMKMLAGFDRYTCGLMSIREGVDNPWRTVMLPLAKEHSILFNVFSAMTCFHIARGDQQLRSEGLRYMRNTVIELARGLSDGNIAPEIALVTCLCLQNSETWDRQTSTGIAHLKGAKSMLIEILKNIQNGKKFLLDNNYEDANAESVVNGQNVKKDKYGLILDSRGSLALQRQIPKNLLFLFNSFVYFDALARLTSESNDDIYGEKQTPRNENLDDCAIVSDDEGSQDGSDSQRTLNWMSSRTQSASPRKSPLAEPNRSPESSTSFIDLFNTINLEGNDIDPLLGCAHSLFPIIGKTATLVSKAKKEAKNSLSIVSAAVVIKSELEQWRPPTAFNLSQNDKADFTSCISTAEAYRYATLIHLHQAVPEIPSRSSHELSEKVLMLLASIPTSSRTCITHIFPLLVASCEARPGDERTWVLEKWDLLIRKMWIGNIDRSLEVVKECWIRRDIMAQRKKNKKKEDKNKDRAEDLASRIASYVASAQGDKKTEEEDISISGIRSWCHWTAVMKEWEWEVFLG